VGDCHASCLLNLAGALDAQGEAAEAEKVMRQAVAQYEQLAARCPTDLEYRWGVEMARTNTAGILAGLRRFDEARPLLEKARAGYEILAREHSKNAELAMAQADNLRTLGSVHLQLGTYADAVMVLRAASEVYAPYVADPEVMRSQADVLILEGSALARDNKTSEALERLTATRKALASLPPNLRVSPPFRCTAADAAIQLARVHLSEKRFADASMLLDESTRALDELVNQNADAALFRRKAAEAWYVRALVAGATLGAKAPEASRQRLADDAVSSLDRAKTLGYFADPANAESARAEPCFASLSKDERFTELLRGLSPLP
jgi:tetratricopeptide (TPR) repeat protein